MMNSYLLLQLKDLYKRYDKSDYGDRRPDEGSLIPNIRKTREIIGNKSNHITLIYSVL